MAGVLPSTSASPPRAWWWVALRVLWLLLVAARLADFLPFLPTYLSVPGRICGNGCVFTLAEARELQQTGISFGAYAAVMAGLFALTVVTSCTVAFILYWRRSHDWMALVVAYFLVIFPINSFSSLIPPDAPQSLFANGWPDLILGLPAILCSYGTFLLFPSGRFTPKWSWALLIAWMVWYPLYHLWPDALGGYFFLGYLVFYLGAIACQVYRYRRVSTPTERQQTKWVAVGFVGALVVNQVFWLLQGVASPIAFVTFAIYTLSLLVVPVSFYIAMQRYRLYDIDVIINRTLVYGSLTAILAGVYLLGVVGVQQALNQLFHQGGDTYPPVVVVTTLVVAALFQPLRRALQSAIDRRFYRTKYDAAQTLAAFGAALRRDIDLSACEERLLDAVETTMQPAQVFLWLREPAQPRDRRASSM